MDDIHTAAVGLRLVETLSRQIRDMREIVLAQAARISELQRLNDDLRQDLMTQQEVHETCHRELLRELNGEVDD